MKTLRKSILSDFAASFWLKDAIRAMDKRDILDAIADAEALTAVLKEKYAATTGGK